MKKEFVALGILGLFIFGYVLDYLAGPLSLVIKSPFAFFTTEMLTKYPFTAVSIFIKTLALALSTLLVFSFFEKKLLTKSLILFILAALLELYSIQALASGTMLIQLQWILALTASGLVLLGLAVLFLVLGIVALIIEKMTHKQPEVAA